MFKDLNVLDNVGNLSFLLSMRLKGLLLIEDCLSFTRMSSFRARVEYSILGRIAHLERILFTSNIVFAKTFSPRDFV